jgi:hypothetical protein
VEKENLRLYPLRTRPKPGEDRASWVVRLLARYGDDFEHLRRIFWSEELEETTTDRIATRTGTDAATALQTLFRDAVDKLHSQGVYAWPHVLTNIAEPRRFCVECLAGDIEPYTRGLWSLGWLLVCPIHHSLLSSCPHCGNLCFPSPKIWHNKPLAVHGHCWGCGLDLRRLDIQKPLQNRKYLEQQLRALEAFENERKGIPSGVVPYHAVVPRLLRTVLDSKRYAIRHINQLFDCYPDGHSRPDQLTGWRPEYFLLPTAEDKLWCLAFIDWFIQDWPKRLEHAWSDDLYPSVMKFPASIAIGCLTFPIIRGHERFDHLLVSRLLYWRNPHVARYRICSTSAGEAADQKFFFDEIDELRPQKKDDTYYMTASEKRSHARELKKSADLFSNLGDSGLFKKRL